MMFCDPNSVFGTWFANPVLARVKLQPGVDVTPPTSLPAKIARSDMKFQ
jgi:hypothetical protein